MNTGNIGNNSLGGSSNFEDIEPPIRAHGDNDEACRQLNSFLRGEISAAETYKMAIDKVKGEQNVATTVVSADMLREIQEEHGRAAQAIRDRIRELGGRVLP